jgi:hypothetical protein
MSTRTRATQRRTTTSARRFARSGSTPQPRRTGTAGRPRTTARPRAIDVARRRTPKKSGRGQAVQALTGLLGGKKAAKSTGKGAKAGAGAAMLTAAAGLAFKNRDKLTSMLKRGKGAPETSMATPPAGTTGNVVHSPATAPSAGTAGMGMPADGQDGDPRDERL